MSTPTPTPPHLPKIPEDVSPDLPITLTASVVLTALPRDGKLALDAASHPKPTKVTLKFKAMGNAPVLNKDTYKIKTTQRFENVVVFLRQQLELGAEQSLLLYVNWSFMPALDENVGNLWSSFKTADELIINYSLQSAFG
ncbi:ubiquitin-like autophagy protein Apg12-domain-containing protein [Tricharina praecox]|uniref:ubiquitin-like autophagy protein Apg12-domain-containing protein n=1 Tax=Tricharina praecox TaxID=43433 RepID=UPI00221F9D8E|nr:ubiquitin-like autophagy protein Apg12-domain-containing protein [Tricharina praecox]KAI5849698.1 ubiquitin-like autophagy protein Apg12-domain-containing protein [Tricharina praecox]